MNNDETHDVLVTMSDELMSQFALSLFYTQPTKSAAVQTRYFFAQQTESRHERIFMHLSHLLSSGCAQSG